MAKDNVDVVVAAYQSVDAARADVDSLVQLVKTRTVRVEGVILVSHELDGTVTVVDTGDHVGRKGAGWGAGVGLAVGLFAPPLLAAVAVGRDNGKTVDAAYRDKAPYVFTGTVKKVVIDLEPEPITTETELHQAAHNAAAAAATGG